MLRTNETGRSMVEMLGVLAVMGVLSVSGVAMYTTAMNKHRANELLNEASKRAVVAAGKLLNSNTASLSEFLGQKVPGGTFTDTSVTRDENNQFTLSIMGVSEAVCDQMKNGLSSAIQKFEPEDCATSATVKLTFNATLSSEGTAEPVIDNSIDNAEDCASANKTWCPGLNETGACSNVSDCCKGVSVTNSCQKCVSGTGEIVNKLDATSCDSDGDGTNDGICYPVEPAGTTCSGTSIENLCLNGVQFQPASTSMCLPISCKVLEQMEASQCCYEYDLQGILNEALNAYQNNNMSKVYDMADQSNIAQCVSCDTDTGNTTNVANGTTCQYIDVPTYLSTGNGLPGTCQSGKCVRVECNGFWAGFIGEKCYSCDVKDPIWIDDGNAARSSCLSCSDRMIASVGNNDSSYCVFKNKTTEGIFLVNKSTSGSNIYEAYACQLLGSYDSPDKDSCENGCKNTPFQRQFINGKCILNTCPSGYYASGYGWAISDGRLCTPCDLQDEGEYGALVNINSKMKGVHTVYASSEECAKCNGENAVHKRTYDDGICRY